MRITEPSARFLLVVLSQLQSPPTEVLNVARESGGNEERESAGILLNAQYEDGLMLDVEEIKKELSLQLNSSNIDVDSTIVDSLVRILQMPYTRNILSGEMLAQLKRTILSSSELRGLNERLLALERSCAGCGSALTSGEMTTLMRNQERGETSYSIFCSNCRRPQYKRCMAPSCQELINMASSSGLCSEHEMGASVVSAPAPARRGRLANFNTAAATASRNLMERRDPPSQTEVDQLLRGVGTLGVPTQFQPPPRWWVDNALTSEPEPDPFFDEGPE